MSTLDFQGESILEFSIPDFMHQSKLHIPLRGLKIAGLIKSSKDV